MFTLPARRTEASHYRRGMAGRGRRRLAVGALAALTASGALVLHGSTVSLLGDPAVPVVKHVAGPLADAEYALLPSAVERHVTGLAERPRPLGTTAPIAAILAAALVPLLATLRRSRHRVALVGVAWSGAGRGSTRAPPLAD